MLPACSEPWHGLLPLLAHQPHDSAAKLQTTTSIEVKTKGCGRNHQADHHWHLRHLRHEIPNDIPIRSMGNPPNAARCPVSVLPFPFPDQSMALTPSQIAAQPDGKGVVTCCLSTGPWQRKSGTEILQVSYHWIGLREMYPILKPIQW